MRRLRHCPLHSHRNRKKAVKAAIDEIHERRSRLGMSVCPGRLVPQSELSVNEIMRMIEETTGRAI